MDKITGLFHKQAANAQKIAALEKMAAAPVGYASSIKRPILEPVKPTVLKEAVAIIIAADVSARDILAAVSAVKSYIVDAYAKTKSWNKLYKQMRKLELAVFVQGPQEYRWLFEKVIPECTYKTIEDDDTWDYVTRLSTSVARNIAAAGNLHISQSYGVILGSNPQSLPDLTSLLSSSSYNSNTVLLVAETQEDAAYFEELMKPVSTVTETILTTDVYTEDIVQKINSFEAVVGIAGFETYMASCFKKPVLEFVLPEDLGFYSQWTNPFYTPVVMSDESVLDMTNLRSAMHRMVSFYRARGMKRQLEKSVVEG